ncbi:hypothetical protein NQ317_001511 [Molorchus minor]|uniref:Fumarate reductase/succinate dehydrogenase flavoprotein-like C-terminal domain-containing protein n=1 Tax=Molorchus minor TaxID=1323400 RepID=A0ABQ9JWV7_9CUCU|nr:hypothetical protein NQ317_001511 [Molorchus minor]
MSELDNGLDMKIHRNFGENQTNKNSLDTDELKYAENQCFREGWGKSALDNLDRFRHTRGKITVGDLRDRLQRTMQKYAGVFRTEKLLQTGCKEVSNLYCEMSKLKVAYSQWRCGWATS